MKNVIINERCPLHDECGKAKCEYKYKEGECLYYMGNARPGFEITPSDPAPVKDLDALFDKLDDEIAEAKEAFGSTFEDEGKMLRYIPVDEIYPHPDNPRKDLGDLGELVDSIKANGIFQNLTVVPLKSKLKPNMKLNGYTVIIGHRRLEAAKRAGLEVVPCIITEMTEQEQLATMLLENMQRSDLTPWEEAQGFQLMMDLGSTVSEIAEKTGFSQRTIKHRIKMLELDEQAFKASAERGATLSDYIKLEKIEDIDLRNKVLASVGTTNFDWQLSDAIRTQESRKKRAEWFTFFESIAVAEKIDKSERPFKKFIQSWFINGALTDDNKKFVAEKLAECEEKGTRIYWCIDLNDNWLYLLTDKTEEDTVQNTEAAEKEARRKAKCERLREIAKTAHELRREFVKSYTGKKEDLNTVIFAFYEHRVDIDAYNHTDEEYAEILGFKVDEDTESYDTAEFKELVFKNPQKVLLASIYTDIEDENHIPNCHDYYGNYSGNSYLPSWYALLEKLGYQMSTEEKQMLDGTHPAYKDGEQE